MSAISTASIACSAQCFKGLEPPEGVRPRELPEEWLRKLAEKLLTPEEMAQIEALGGFEKIMETLKRAAGRAEGTAPGRLEMDRHRRHLALRRLWLQSRKACASDRTRSRHRRAVKVWDKREFRDLDDTVELGTRNLKLALRRLRRFARQGAATELDLPDTIRSTANNAGMLDLKMVPERHNTVKVLLFLDIGGSMDDMSKLGGVVLGGARRSSSIWSISTSTTSPMSGCGRTTAAATTNKCRPWRCCAPTGRTTS